jgi:DNA-binding transcriptional LysR family regulator
MFLLYLAGWANTREGPMINWNFLETFAVLADVLNFSEAARILSTSQPVVSRQIQLLEHELGYPLFVRSTKQVSLTTEGLELKTRLTPLLEEMKRLLSEKQLKGDVLSGRLRVGAVPEGGRLLLLPHLIDFMEQHPALEVHTTFLPSRQVNDEILRGTLDIGFVHEVKDRKSIHSIPLMDDVPVLIATKKRARKWKESGFAGEPIPMIAYRENDIYMENMLDRTLSKSERKRVIVKASINYHSAMIDLVCRMNAFAVLPKASAQEALSSGQIEILAEGTRSEKLFLIIHEDGLHDRRRRALVEFLTGKI